MDTFRLPQRAMLVTEVRDIVLSVEDGKLKGLGFTMIVNDPDNDPLVSIFPYRMQLGHLSQISGELDTLMSSNNFVIMNKSTVENIVRNLVSQFLTKLRFQEVQ